MRCFPIFAVYIGSSYLCNEDIIHPTLMVSFSLQVVGHLRRPWRIRVSRLLIQLCLRASSTTVSNCDLDVSASVTPKCYSALASGEQDGQE